MRFKTISFKDNVTRRFAVYLPPSYGHANARYPSIYVLHGFLGNAGTMTTIKPTIDSMIRNDDIGEMILVFPDGSNRFNGSMYQSSETIGDYETYIISDLVNYVNANYRTLSEIPFQFPIKVE